MMKRIFLVMAAAAAPLVFAGQGHAAQSLPAFSGGTFCENTTLDPSVGQGATSCNIDGAGATLDLLPAIKLTAFAEGPAGGLTNGSAHLTYYFEVTGGAGVVQVPIIILTNMSTSFIGDAGADAEIAVDADYLDSPENAIFRASQTVCANSEDNACTGFSASFSGALHLTALSGVAGRVLMSVSASGVNGGIADAYADPLIEIDPSFADAGLYKVIPSDGVGNVLPNTGVPEPASWALMLVGFGMAGAALQRPRTAVRVA